ncbi:MAG: carbohydrate binding domain-containing protein [Taibaiella sp.]|nr:carbohydrate binding domain-containing protein [Taibaiella sp.]
MNSKEVLRSVTIMLAIAGSAVLLHSCSKPMSESVIDKQVGLNGGFEVVEKGLPVNWLVYTAKTTGSGDLDIVSDSNGAKEGRQSLRFDVRGCSAKGGWYSPGIAQEVAASPGVAYKISFWAKNAGADCKVTVSGVTALDHTTGPQVQLSENIADWRRYELVYKMPENMKRLRIEVSVLTPGVFWIDGVTVEQVGG